MKKEDALALSEQAVSELAVALAAGKSDKLKHYLKMMGSFHSYSFCNCMLIARQFPTATSRANTVAVYYCKEQKSIVTFDS